MVNTMDKHRIFTSDYISNAVNDIKKIKPDYSLLLELYERIFIEHENSRNLISQVNPLVLTESISEKSKGQFPLVDVSQFIIDGESSEKLFIEICGILLTAGNGVTESVRRAVDALECQTLHAKELFSAFIGGDESFLAEIAEKFNIDIQVLIFLIYNSLKPSLNMFSRALSGSLDEEKEWGQGFCPVCGSMPELSVFEENGKRSLLCGFCGYQWLSKRIYCPFCGNTDHETLQYFEIEGEEEYRVDVCEKCCRYIKTLDMKKTSRLVYLPLEIVSTPYIDVRFKEMGYKAGNAVIE